MTATSGLLSRIQSLSSALGAPLSGEGLLFAQCWLSLLKEWNAKIDLTAARGDDELVDLMLADGALLSRHVAQGAYVVDVGTGAGAPGLGLFVFRPDLQGTLVEPMQKRVAFLNAVIGDLITKGLPPGRVRVVRERVEKLGARDEPGAVMISRATLSPLEWLSQGARLAPKGEVWVLLAQQDAPELSGWKAILDLEYRWPLTGARRRALCFRPVV